MRPRLSSSSSSSIDVQCFENVHFGHDGIALPRAAVVFLKLLLFNDFHCELLTRVLSMALRVVWVPSQTTIPATRAYPINGQLDLCKGSTAECTTNIVLSDPIISFLCHVEKIANLGYEAR